MSLHLVTGHSGKAHITAADQGALNACLFGVKDYVLNSGENFAASVITNNQIRIADGELLMQGRHIRLAKGTYEDLTIENGSQGVNRNDLIVVRYSKNADSGIEEATLSVIKGTEATGTATDPECITGDILSGDCTLHEMPLYRIPLTGLTVGTPVPLFKEENGGIRIEKLWENASPTSNFAAQTISLDLSDYDMVEIHFRFSTSSKNEKNAKVENGNDFFVDFVARSSDKIYGAYRTGSCNSDGVYITECYAVTGTTATSNNGLAIPTKIYGIKGVQ